MDAIQVPSNSSFGRHTKSAPCRRRKEPDRRSSDDVTVSDLESVARSAPGDWSSGSLSPASSGSGNLDKLFFSFPYAASSKSTTHSSRGDGNREVSAAGSQDNTSNYDYEDDFDQDVDAFGEKYSSASGSGCKSRGSDVNQLPPEMDEEEDIDALITRWRTKIQEDEEVAAAAAGLRSVAGTASSSDVSGYDVIADYRTGSRYNHLTKEEDEMKRYKMEVMRKLLAEFDLNKTIDRYKGMDAVSYRLNPRDFSYDCSMEAQIFKNRIHTLTGSESLRINDPYYREHLRQKLRHEYELEQDRLEKEREERERERMRRLVTRGVIGAEDLRNDRILAREYRLAHGLNDSGRTNKKRSKNRKQSPQRAKSAPQTCRQQRTRVASSRSPERRSRIQSCKSRDQYLHPSAACRSTSPACCYGNRRPTSTIGLYLPRSGSFSRDENMSSISRRPVTSVPGHRSRDSVTSSTVDSDRDSVNSRPSSRSSGPRGRSEHPAIRQLHEEETLEGLYRLAAEIIPESERERRRVVERTKTQEELELEEENKYRGKKVVAKIKF